MDSKNKTQSSLCAAERDGTGTWLIPLPVLMAASVIHIPMLCSSPGKARQHGKHGQKGMWMNSSSRPSRNASCGELDPLGSSRPSRNASCGELDPLGLNLYYGLQWQKVGLLYLQNQSASPAFTGGMVIRPVCSGRSGPSIPAEPKRFSRFYRRNGHSTSLQWQKVGLLYLQNQSASPAFTGGMVIRPDESQ